MMAHTVFSIESTEEDDDYIVLCHHWNRWVLLSLQFLLIKGETPASVINNFILFLHHIC